MNTTRKEVRAAFKKTGYKVSFVRNPFNGSVCNIAFKDDTMSKPCEVSSASAYGADFRTKHASAFNLALSYNQHLLTDTDQKIV